jgi:hypothetical protein
MVFCFEPLMTKVLQKAAAVSAMRMIGKRHVQLSDELEKRMEEFFTVSKGQNIKGAHTVLSRASPSLSRK